MKKMKHSGKKVLSVFLAVLMVMTAWVFVAPEKASATAAATVAGDNTVALNSIPSFNTNVTTIHGSFESDSDYLETQYYDAIYKNVLYTDGPVSIAASATSPKTEYGNSWTGSNGVTLYWYHATATVMYDGETTPSLGVCVNPVMYYTGTWSRKSVNRLSWIESGGNGFTINENWHGSDGRLNFNYMWHGQSAMMGYDKNDTGNTSMFQTLSGNSDNHFYANLLKFTGSMSDTEFSRSAQPYFGFYGDNGDNGKKIYAQSGDTLYVINYKPLKAALNEALGTGTYSISTLKASPAKYTNASIAEYVAAVKDLIAAKPNNYVNVSNNDYVGYANAASAAVTRFNNAKANLEVQQYTLKFTNINGVEKYSQTYDYGTAVNCPEIAASLGNTIQQYNDQYHQTHIWDDSKYVSTIIDDVEIVEKPSGTVAHDYGSYTQGETNHSRTCSVCGYVQTQNHIENSGTVDRVETCTQDGIKTYDCTVCGKTDIRTETINNITGHNFSGDYVLNVDGKDGTHYKKCVRCDAYGLGTTENDCEAHKWDKNADNVVNALDGEVVTPATCTTPGLRKYSCSLCDATYTEAIPATGHQNVTKTAAKDVTNICGGDGNAAFWTCSDCGKIYTDEALKTEVSNYTDADNDGIPDALEVKGPDHDFTGACVNVSNGADGTHYRQCSRFTQCGEYGLMVDGKAVVGATEAHKFTSTETASSCTVQGTKTYICSDCNHSYTEKLPLVAHTMETIAAVAATCTTGGNDKYYKCTACSQYFKDENGTTVTTVEAEKIAALKHTFIAGNDIADPTNDRLETAATCLAPAVYVTTCDRCGVESPDSKYSHGDPIAHVYSGTKKSNGDGTHSYACTNACACGTYGVGSTKDAKENCIYSTYAKIDTAKHKVSCSCGDYKEEDHFYGLWIADKTGLGTEKGTMTRTCSLCKQTETTECSYEVLGRINATCDDPGSVTYKCTDANCGHTYTETLPALGHEWVENNETYLKSAATCEANAEYYKYCTKCQKSSQAYTGETWTKKGSKLTHDWNEWVQSVDENGVATHTRTCKHASSASCTETGTCSGGVATCMNRAVCSTCNAEYGDINEENHVNKDFVAKVDSTCQVEGTEAYYKCTACNTNIETPVVIAKKDHSYGTWTKIDGEDKHTRYCTTCDAAVAEVATETAPCSGGVANCVELATCVTCKGKYGSTNPDVHKTEANHLVGKKDATCQAPGYTGDYLYDCCNALKEEGTAIAQLAHTFSIEVEGTKVAATCIAKGEVIYKCSTCVESEGVTAATQKKELPIDAKNHASEETITVNAKAATCESDGHTGDVYYSCCYDSTKTEAENRKALKEKGTVIKANGQHIYGEAVPEYLIKAIKEVKDDEGNVIRKEFDLKDANALTYDEMIAARRDDDKWYHAQICTICDEVTYDACYTYAHTSNCVKTDTCEICEGLCSLKSPLVHPVELDYVAEESATCSEDGVKAHYVCSVCGEKFSDALGKKPVSDDDLKIDSAGGSHDIDYESAKPIGDGKHEYGCTRCSAKIEEECDGGTDYCNAKAKCEICGQEYGEIDETNHASTEVTLVGRVEATCSEDGYEGDEYYECCYDENKTKEENQKALKKEGKVIPSKPELHVIAYKETDGDTHTAYCTACIDADNAYSVTVAHEWVAGETPELESCTDEVVITSTCVCGKTKTETIVGEHDFEITVETKAATCSEAGYKKTFKACKKCNYSEELPEEILEKLPHNIVTEEAVKPTCDGVGKHAYTYCKNPGCPYGYKKDLFIGSLAGYEAYKNNDGKTVDKLGHQDKDNNGSCDNCYNPLKENIDGTRCNCICHKQNILMKIIYKILQFFWKLFKIEQTCGCGTKHW